VHNGKELKQVKVLWG